MGKMTRTVLAVLAALALSATMSLSAAGCQKKCDNSSGSTAAGNHC